MAETKPEVFEPKEQKEQREPVVDEPELKNVGSAFPKDRYKPLRELGRGANGIVYLCRDRLLGKKVAVKMLESLTSESIIDFQREAKIASGLNHPGIVRVLDFGADHSCFTDYSILQYARL
ncbi:MAG: protein kinase [Candidatus Obscuribacterales bacterium]|nr:protein kinase [Candidatus Obscuribacterales bacterium]